MKIWRKPLDSDRIHAPAGTVQIIVERCKGCGFCITYCPRDVLVLSDDFNRKGYHYPDIVKEGMCVNCGLCANICPEFAIFSEEETVNADKAQQEGCICHEKP